MAFPTSPSNNQVHKEGNRAFVYDSALGVWDHVRESDRVENRIYQGDIGIDVFPAGHIIGVEYSNTNTSYTSTNMTEVVCTNFQITYNKKISNSTLHIHWTTLFNLYQSSSTAETQIIIDFDRTLPTSSSNMGQTQNYMRNENGTGAYDNHYYSGAGQFIDTSSATGNHKYQCHITGGRSGATDSRARINGMSRTHESTLTVFEVVTS